LQVCELLLWKRC